MCPMCSAPMVGKKPTSSPLSSFRDFRHARYSAIVEIVFIFPRLSPASMLKSTLCYTGSCVSILPSKVAIFMCSSQNRLQNSHSSKPEGRQSHVAATLTRTDHPCKL